MNTIADGTPMELRFRLTKIRVIKCDNGGEVVTAMIRQIPTKQKRRK